MEQQERVNVVVNSRFLIREILPACSRQALRSELIFFYIFYDYTII